MEKGVLSMSDRPNFLSTWAPLRAIEGIALRYAVRLALVALRTSTFAAQLELDRSWSGQGSTVLRCNKRISRREGLWGTILRRGTL